MVTQCTHVIGWIKSGSHIMVLINDLINKAVTQLVQNKIQTVPSVMVGAVIYFCVSV